MSDRPSRIRAWIDRTRRQTPWWLFAWLLVLVAAGFGYGYWFGELPADGNAGPFLRSLAAVQASLVGIVFAVTILGAQLVANRYTTRMTSLFVTHPVFVLTFASVLGSIALDLGLVFGLLETVPAWYVGAFYAAVGLAAANAFAVFAFVRVSLRLSTPEGVVAAFEDRYTPATCVVRALDADDDDETDPPHPLLGLQAVALSAIDDDDSQTARTAIEAYERVATGVLAAAVENGWLPALSTSQLEYLFAETVESHLPAIALRAAGAEDADLVERALDVQREFAVAGLDADYGRIPERSVDGLADLTAAAPVSSRYAALHDAAWTAAGSLLVETATAGEHRRLQALLVRTGEMVDGLDGTFDPAVHRDPVARHVGDLRRVHDAVLAGVEGRDDGEFEDGEFRHSDLGRALATCRDALCGVSAAVVGSVDPEADRYPVDDGAFVDEWRACCVAAVERGPPGYARSLCRALVELAYVDPLCYPDHRGHWVPQVAEVMYRTDRGPVDAAFEYARGFEALSGDRRARSYPNLVRVDGYVPLNGHEEFETRLRDLRRSVDASYAEYERDAGRATGA